MRAYSIEAEIKYLNRLVLNAEDALKEAMANVDKTELSIAARKHFLSTTDVDRIDDKDRAGLEQLRHKLIKGLSLVDDAQQLLKDIEQRINMLKNNINCLQTK